MNYLRKAIGSALVLTTLATTAHADTFLGVYAEATAWNYDGKTTFTQTTTNQTFDFDTETTAVLSVALEHGVPFLPNIKVKNSAIDSSKQQNVFLVLDGKTFSANTTTAADLALTDVFAYYEVLDNVVSLDLGLGAKIVKGDLTVSDNVNTLKEDVSETIPVLYASAGGSLPFTGLSAKAELSGISYDQNKLMDIQAEVKYDFIDNVALDVGVKAGYRALTVDIKDILKTSAQSDFKGPYLGLEAHF